MLADFNRMKKTIFWSPTFCTVVGDSGVMQYKTTYLKN